MARPAEVSHWVEQAAEREKRVLRFGKESQQSQSEGRGLHTIKAHTGKSRCGLSVPSNWVTEMGCGESQGGLEVEN